MEPNRKITIFLGLVALFIGSVGGYVLGGNTFSSRNNEKLPPIFGVGIEKIDTFRDPDGKYFDLVSTFAFTDEYFHCVVSTNDGTFTLPTYSMGNVTIPKHAFAMAIDSVSVENVKKTDAGKIEMTGKAKSITRVGEKYEEAAVPFKVTAVDGGSGYTNDSLVLTVYYDKDASPMQHAIFGPEAHFGHGILSGDIFIARDIP